MGTTRDKRENFKRGIKAGTADRIEQANQVSRLRRSAMLNSLRLQALQGREADEAVGLERTPDTAARAVRDALRHSRDPTQFGQALHHLRLVLGNPVASDEEREAMSSAALEGGLVKVLAAALRPSLVGGAAAAAALKASWIACNVAAAPPPIADQLLPLGPLLIAHLGGGYGVDLAMQCAWTIANLAGDSKENRGVLIAQGALRPLLTLLEGGTGRGADRLLLRAASTAAWALCNLIKGGDLPAMRALVALPGFSSVVSAALRDMKSWDTVLEVSWLLSYLAAASEPLLSSSLDGGLLPVLLDALIATTSPSPSANEHGNRRNGHEADDCAAMDSTGGADVSAVDIEANDAHGPAEQALVPLLRCLGNLAPDATQAQLDTLLTWNQGAALTSIVAGAAAERCWMHKEALWALSNIASHKACADALLARGALQAVTQRLHAPELAIRIEAAYALANLCNSGGLAAIRESVGNDEEAMRAVMQLLQAADWGAVRLALEFSRLVCTLMQADGEGALLVERCGGLDVIEQLCVSEHVPDDVAALAAHVLSQHFRRDP